jgi:HK97 family phage prohead protease
MKTKDFALQVKGLSDEGTFEGYGSIFGNRDSYGEKVMPGAFAESLKKHEREGSKPIMLWQHNSDEPIGVWENVSEDGKGLKMTGRFIREVRRGDEAYALTKAGAVTGLSIGYREVEVQPDGKDRLLKKLDLLEVSLVTFPANCRARVESVKSELMEDFARRLRDGEPPSIKEFEELLREAGIPKSMATQIASVGYAKAIRSDSEGKNDASDFLRALMA